jgi:hypothetical protein
MEEKKVTKRDNFVEIREVLEKAGEVDLAAVMSHEIELLDKKAESNKVRAAKRKIEGDQLRDTISNILTDDLQTVDEIVEQIDNAEISKAKVVARLTQLVKIGEAEKEQVTTDDKKKVMAYRRV